MFRVVSVAVNGYWICSFPQNQLHKQSDFLEIEAIEDVVHNILERKQSSLKRLQEKNPPRIFKRNTHSSLRISWSEKRKKENSISSSSPIIRDAFLHAEYESRLLIRQRVWAKSTYD